MEKCSYIERVRRVTALSTLVLGGWAHQPAPVTAEERPTEPTGAITIEQVLTLVREQSPELGASAWDVRAAESQSRYAGRWNNPTVSVQVEDALGTNSFRRFSQAQATLEVGQVFELGKKAKKRAALARGAKSNAERDYEHDSAMVLGQARVRFTHVLADQQRLVAAREAVVFSRDALAAAKRRVRAGAASNIEERRARVVLARTLIDEEHAEHELLASRYRLAALWGSTEPKFDVASGDLFARDPLPAFEEVSAGVADNPELRRLGSERELRDAQVAVAKSKAYPNLRIAAGPRWLMSSDDLAIVASATLPLPLVNRNRGQILATRARRQKLGAEQLAARVRIHAELFTQYQELAHVIVALATLEKEVLPEATAVMRTTELGFRRGRLSQLELVDAQRTLMELRREHIDMAEKYHKYVVRLETLTGQSLVAAAEQTR